MSISQLETTSRLLRLENNNWDGVTNARRMRWKSIDLKLNECALEISVVRRSHFLNHPLQRLARKALLQHTRERKTQSD